jgi:hypothetical protein
MRGKDRYCTALRASSAQAISVAIGAMPQLVHAPGVDAAPIPVVKALLCLRPNSVI